MFSDVRKRLQSAVSDRSLFLPILLVAACASAAAAAPLSRPKGRQSLVVAVTEALAATPAEPPPEVIRTWDGADVDGDGVADFANPTGQDTRGHDAYGEGEFGASRDGGSRRHEGVDFCADAGQAVKAPISGYVTKIGFAYPGDRSLKFIEITNPALNYAARVFYVDPAVEVGDTVALGDEIGTAHSLKRKYPRGMTNHVHLEILDRRDRRIDASRMITADDRSARTLVATAD